MGSSNYLPFDMNLLLIHLPSKLDLHCRPFIPQLAVCVLGTAASPQYPSDKPLLFTMKYEFLGIQYEAVRLALTEFPGARISSEMEFKIRYLREGSRVEFYKRPSQCFS